MVGVSVKIRTAQLQTVSLFGFIQRHTHTHTHSGLVLYRCNHFHSRAVSCPSTNILFAVTKTTTVVPMLLSPYHHYVLYHHYYNRLYLLIIIIIIIIMQGIHTYIPIANNVSSEYSVVSIPGTCNAISNGKYFVLLY